MTPWYPDRVRPAAGIFVHHQVEALRAAGVEVVVEVMSAHPSPSSTNLGLVRDAVDRLAERSADALYGADSRHSIVPTLEPVGGGYAARSHEFALSLAVKRRHRPVEADVVHAHTALPSGHAALALGSDVPVVVTEHFSGTGRLIRRRDTSPMYRSVMERAASFWFVSERLRSTVGATFPDLAFSSGVLPNVVDLGGIPWRERSARGTNWLYVGALASGKNLELVLSSFVRYRSSHPAATLTLVGDGPLRTTLERDVERWGVAERVRFVGAVDRSNIGAFLHEADVYVHLSTAETFGISTVEAIGAGLPIVSLDNGAAPEVWGDIESIVGRILPVDADENDVCEAIEGIASLRTFDPVRARAFVIERFAPAAVAAKLMSVYRRHT